MNSIENGPSFPELEAKWLVSIYTGMTSPHFQQINYNNHARAGKPARIIQSTNKPFPHAIYTHYLTKEFADKIFQMPHISTYVRIHTHIYNINNFAIQLNSIFVFRFPRQHYLYWFLLLRNCSQRFLDLDIQFAIYPRIVG